MITMDIVLDIGNTLVKIAIFEEDRMIDIRKFEHDDYSDLLAFVSEIGINNKCGIIGKVLISSTVGEIKAVSDVLKQHFKVIVVDKSIALPIVNLYVTKETLGYDRVASVIGGRFLFPASNVMTINIGTCLICDFINSDGEYLGGSISCGLKQRFKSLNSFTAKLPLIDIDRREREIELIGRNTRDSILSGVINGMKFEIERFIAEYRNKYKDLKIIISGGDMRYFEGKLGDDIFYVDDLIIIGLHQIMKYE